MIFCQSKEFLAYGCTNDTWACCLMNHLLSVLLINIGTDRHTCLWCLISFEWKSSSLQYMYFNIPLILHFQTEERFQICDMFDKGQKIWKGTQYCHGKKRQNTSVWYVWKKRGSKIGKKQVPVSKFWVAARTLWLAYLTFSGS